VQVVLSKTSAVPLYEQIRSQLHDAIYSGDVGVGSRLPSLRQLAAELRVSILTVTRAYNDLVAAGAVDNVHGLGFVVLPVDAETAREHLSQALAEAALGVVRAARAARVGAPAVHDLIDSVWEEP